MTAESSLQLQTSCRVSVVIKSNETNQYTGDILCAIIIVNRALKMPHKLVKCIGWHKPPQEHKQQQK